MQKGPSQGDEPDETEQKRERCDDYGVDHSTARANAGLVSLMNEVSGESSGNLFSTSAQDLFIRLVAVIIYRCEDELQSAKDEREKAGENHFDSPTRCLCYRFQVT